MNRIVFVRSDGTAFVVDGRTNTYFDLDKAVREGNRILSTWQLRCGVLIFLLPPEKPV